MRREVNSDGASEGDGKQGSGKGEAGSDRSRWGKRGEGKERDCSLNDLKR